MWVLGCATCARASSRSSTGTTIEVLFSGLAIVAAVALAAPLALGLFPRVRLPAIVLEIVLGIVIGPQVLGWVSVDTRIH